MTNSNYDVAITLGPYAFTVHDGDLPSALDAVYVLDGMNIDWAFTEADPVPAQPNPVESSITLLTRDVVNLHSVDVGTAAQFKLTSAGTLIASFTGRVDDITATPIRRFNATTELYEQWISYDIQLSDYRVDLNEVPVTIVRPQERIQPRVDAINAGIVASGGLPISLPVFSALAPFFDALNAAAQPGLALMVDYLRQIAIAGTFLYGRLIVVPTTVAGVLTGYNGQAKLDQQAHTWPPGKFKLVAHILGLSFVEAPPGSLLGLPLGLAVNAGRVQEAVNYRRSKVTAPNTTTVTGSFGTVSKTYRPDLRPVVQALQSTWSADTEGLSMATMYQPFSDVEPWTVENVVWMPTDAELAALPFPLTEDTDTANIACYQAQVAVYNVPNKINPAGDSGFYAGTLDGVSVQIIGGKVYVFLKINRRLPIPIDDVVDVGVTWDDLKASFPAVTWRTGTDKVDPTLSWNDTRLARR